MRIKEIVKPIAKPGKQGSKNESPNPAAKNVRAYMPELQMMVQQEYGDITDKLMAADNILTQIYYLLLARVKRNNSIRPLK